MTRREQLHYLLENYHDGKYDTKSFCEQFVLIYVDNIDDCDCCKHEKEFMEKFCRLAERYSPYKEDLALSPYFLDDNCFRINFDAMYDEFKKR